MEGQPNPPENPERHLQDPNPAENPERHPMMAGNWLPPPRLPKFSGEDGPVEPFAAETERVLRAYRLQSEVGVELLLRNLEGTARKEVLELPAEERSTPEQVLTHLRSVFSDRRPRVLLLEDFNSRRQLPGENVLTFCHALQDLARKVRAAGGTLSDTDIRDRFVERLSNGQLRRELRRSRTRNPDITLLQLREEALQWLEEEEEEEEQYEVTQQAHSSSTKPSTDSATTATLDAILAAMQGMERRLNSLEVSRGQAQHQPTSTVPTRNQNCYKCGQPGHFRRNCPTKAGKV